jgi:hypothetical protein
MYFSLAFQSKLSALLEFLHKVRYETQQSRKVIQSLCVAAYPDVQPWQVKRACLDPFLVDESKQACGDETLRDFYYSYLSQLLDPIEGHEAAKHNTKLIKVSPKRRMPILLSNHPHRSSSLFRQQEWCEWSIGVKDGDNEKRDQDKLQNFYRVASRTSSAHLAYRRDLPTLLEMSMGIKEYNLALELSKFALELEPTKFDMLTPFLTIAFSKLQLRKSSRIESCAVGPRLFIESLCA